MWRAITFFLASASAYRSSKRLRCAFSMTRMMSAQPSSPSVTMILALGWVPADRTSTPGMPLRISSAVRLRWRLRLQMNRTLIEYEFCISGTASGKEFVYECGNQHQNVLSHSRIEEALTLRVGGHVAKVTKSIPPISMFGEYGGLEKRCYVLI